MEKVAVEVVPRGRRESRGIFRSRLEIDSHYVGKAFFRTRSYAPSEISMITTVCLFCLKKKRVNGFLKKKNQGKSEGFESCDRPSNLTQIGFKSSICQPVWPWNLMDDLEKQ